MVGRSKTFLSATGRTLLLLTLIFSLSGCGLFKRLFGNGEGYPGAIDETFVPDPTNPPPAYLEPIRGMYYYIDPNYVCETSSGQSSLYREKIIVYENESFERRGDPCTNELIERGPSEDLEILDPVLGYGDGIYQKVD